MIIAENGEVVLVTSLCFDNDCGGTAMLDECSMRVKIVSQFYDYETGQRFIGALVDEKDVAALRKLGTTGHAGKYPPHTPGWVWDPAKVYFGDHEIARNA